VIGRKNLESWSGGAWRGVAPACIQGVSIDSRSLQPGELFVALPGEHVDGHEFVKSAAKAGAAAALVSKKRAAGLHDDLPLLIVPDPCAALRRLAQGHRRNSDLRVVGVTGSAGKTTVKELIADMLATRFQVTRTPGNWNNDLGLPLSLLRISSGDAYGVFELGMNQPGEIKRLSGLLSPDVGVITSVGVAHLERFPDEAGIAAEKAALFEALPENGIAVTDADGAWYDRLRRAAACRVVGVSNSDGCDFVRGVVGEERDSRMEIRETCTAEAWMLDLPIPGDFFRTDVSLAAAVARMEGVPWSGIEAAVRNYKPPSMRWNVMEAGGASVVDDSYNANPVSMRAALQAFGNTSVEGSRWLVLGGMRELGVAAEELHRDLGGIVGEGPWAGLVAYGELGGLIAEGARDAGMPEEHIVPVLEQGHAVEQLLDWVQPGDSVLFKGSRAERLDEVVRAFVNRRSHRE
jgi:UDP-N-acetylmuramoyl-tripeptide--D-alanyl-D-alanine ligase